MTDNIYVIDQSYMRSAELRELIRSTNSMFVIPDVAFEEMTRSEEWEATIRGSFGILAPVLDRVIFSASLGELLQSERNSRQPIELAQLMPEPLTAAMRGFIRTVLAGGNRATGMRDAVSEIRLELMAERPDGLTLKARMNERVALLGGLYGPELRRRIRSGRVSDEARLGQLKVLSETFVDQFVKHIPSNPASVTTRVVYGELWLIERWLQKGGLDTVRIERLAHDDLDAEYAVTASFVGGLLTRDKGLEACAADLRRMSAPVSSDLLLSAYKEYVRNTQGLGS